MLVEESLDLCCIFVCVMTPYSDTYSFQSPLGNLPPASAGPPGSGMKAMLDLSGLRFQYCIIVTAVVKVCRIAPLIALFHDSWSQQPGKQLLAKCLGLGTSGRTTSYRRVVLTSSLVVHPCYSEGDITLLLLTCSYACFPTFGLALLEFF